MAEEGAPRRVHLGLAELVEVAQELEHVRAAAPGQLQRRPVIDSQIRNRYDGMEEIPEHDLFRIKKEAERWLKPCFTAVQDAATL